MSGPMSAADYHEFMLASKFDRNIRTAFQRFALNLSSSGSSILDFGAGTGIDSKAYASHGHKVYAYDSSRDMRAYLSRYCRKEIDAGQVTVVELEYDAFLGLRRVCEESLDVITANFAVFNIVDDHARLFKVFDRWLSPNGVIFASLLNPYYIGDARYAWWWRNLGALIRTGRYSVGCGAGVSHRFALLPLKNAANPYFRLDGILHGAMARPYSIRQTALTGAARALSMLISPYMFL